ncbi:hypothetical protein [Pseudomonas syringae]|jgi:hypothetical protein
MNIELINCIASSVITLWATLCVLSSRVRDGVTARAVTRPPGGAERRGK